MIFELFYLKPRKYYAQYFLHEPRSFTRENLFENTTWKCDYNIWDILLIASHLRRALDHVTFELFSWSHDIWDNLLILHWIWVIWVKLLINWAKRSDNLSWCVFGCFAPQVLDCFPPQILYKESIAFHCVTIDVNSGCIFGVF